MKKQGFKTKFFKNYKHRFSSEDIKLTWNRAYRYARRLYKEDRAGFLKSTGEEMSIAEKSYYIIREYDKFGIDSRLSIYYSQDKRKSAKEKMEIAELSVYEDRLNAKTSDKGGSFLEKYGDIEHNGTTINEMLKDENMTAKKLNEFIKDFKESNQYYLDHAQDKEYYENLVKEQEKEDYFSAD